jgi:iron complex outermembrane receptor protein/outer membrane receptor for ferrienterochelin and colicins
VRLLHLYGGGAIGGLINLISKKPSFNPDASFLVNQTTLKETNINAYYAQRSKDVGITFFAGQNIQKQMDVDNDGFSDLPDTKSTLIHPTLFFYPSDKSYISLSWSGSFETQAWWRYAGY